jgi:sialic acid synthase SpsE
MLWVAEVGSAHKGVESLVYEYIRAYSQAGANVLKFQLGWTKEAQERFGLEYNPVRYIDNIAPKISEWCGYHGVKMMASIWSIEGLNTAEAIELEYYKIGRRMWGMDKDFVEVVEQNHHTWVSGRDIFVRSEYPTYPNKLHMPKYFSDWMTGYSDHTHGIEACLLAVSRGATYIEKHVALDKTDLVTRDTPFSATPQEFEQMVKIGNGIRRLLDAES